LPIVWSPLAAVLAFGSVLVAVLLDAPAWATRREGRVGALLGLAVAWLIQLLLATEAGWLLRSLQNQIGTTLLLHVAVSLAFVFLAVVTHARQRADGRAAPLCVEGISTWAWLVAVLRSPLADLPQVVTAAVVVQTWQPLSVLLGAVAAVVACALLGRGTPFGLRVASRLAQRIGPWLFALWAAVSLLAVGLYALSPPG
jgi:putative Ca2+/H+ antiporter (TMEM165/GDT1 family)